MPTTELAIPVARESTYIVVWEFQVKAECEAEFVAAYGPDGEWARLFQRSQDFLGVELLGSVGNAGRFFTLDHWSSSAAMDAFLFLSRLEPFGLVIAEAMAAGLPERTLLTAMGPGFTASCVALSRAA